MNRHDPLTIEEALDHGLAPHDHVFYSWGHDVVQAAGHPALTPDDMRALRRQYADLDLTDQGRAAKARYVAEHEVYRQSAKAPA